MEYSLNAELFLLSSKISWNEDDAIIFALYVRRVFWTFIDYKDIQLQMKLSDVKVYVFTIELSTWYLYFDISLEQFL